MKLRVGIIGCGTAGQAAAIILARAGHRVDVLERAQSLAPVGAGLLLQPTGLAVLAAIGLLPQLLSRGTQITSLHGATDTGRSVLRLDYADLRPDLFGLGIHRGTLFTFLQESVLASGARVVSGIEARSLKAEGDTRFVIDAAGQAHGPFDLVIVADGARSVLRNGHPSVRRCRQYPWGALWFVAEDRDGFYGNTLAQVYRGTGAMIGFLPSGIGPDARRSVSMFWSLRCRNALPVGLDQWKAAVRRLTPSADRILDQISSPEQLIFAAYQDVVMRPCCDGPVVFIGDAAHAMSPQLGQGANLALMDAQSLAKELAEERSIPDSLIRYDAKRDRHVRFYQLASRGLTPLFQSGWEWLAPPRDLLLGKLCRQRWFRTQMLLSLVGVKTGLFRSLPLPKPMVQ